MVMSDPQSSLPSGFRGGLKLQKVGEPSKMAIWAQAHLLWADPIYSGLSCLCLLFPVLCPSGANLLCSENLVLGCPVLTLNMVLGGS